MNDEVKFTLSADTSNIDQALNNTLDTIDSMAGSMDDFLAKIKSLSRIQLDNLDMNLEKDVINTSNEITKLTGKLKKFTDQYDDLTKSKLKLTSEKFAVEHEGLDFTKQKELDNIDEKMKPLSSEIDKLEGQLEGLQDNWEDITQRKFAVSNRMRLIDEQEETNRIKQIKQEQLRAIEEIEASKPEPVLTRMPLEDLDYMNMKMHEFNSLTESLSYNELGKIGDVLVGDLDTAKTMLEDIKGDIAEATQFGDTAGLEEYEYELMNVINQMKTLEQQLLQINQLGDFKKVKQSLQEMGYSTGPETLGNNLDKTKNKASSLQNKIASLGKRIAVAFSVAAFGTFRKAFSDAIAMSDSAQANFGAISNILSSTLVPLVDFLAQKVMYAFAWISKLVFLLTGFNIIGQAIDRTTKNMNKLGAAAGGASSKMKGLLGGFDEINNIGQQTNTGGALGGALGGMEANLEAMKSLRDMFDDIKIPWADKLKEKLIANKELLIAIGIILGTVFATAKLLAFIGQVNNGVTALKGFNAATGLIVGGLALMVGGLVTAFYKWDEMDTKSRALTTGVVGIGGALTAVGITAKVTGVSLATAFSVGTLGIGALVGVLATVVTGLVGQIKKQNEMNKSLKTTKELQEQLEEIENKKRRARRDNIDAINDQKQTNEELIRIQKETHYIGEELFRSVEGGTLTYEKMNEEQKRTYDAYIKNDDALHRINETEKEVQKTNKEGILVELEKQGTNLLSAKSFEDYKARVIQAEKDGTISTEEARDLFEKAMADMDREAAYTYVQSIPDKIKNGLNPDKYVTAMNKFKNFFHDLFTYLGVNFSKLQGQADFLKKSSEVAKKGLETSISMYNNGFAPGTKVYTSDGKVKSFAVGTNSVPNDMIAQIHKGEAIIPEKFNDEKYFGNNSQDMTETNGLLEDIHSAISRLKLIVDRDSIGEASVDYIQQQNRIRGEAII